MLHEHDGLAAVRGLQEEPRGAVFAPHFLSVGPFDPSVAVSLHVFHCRSFPRNRSGPVVMVEE